MANAYGSFWGLDFEPIADLSREDFAERLGHGREDDTKVFRERLQS